MLSSLEIYIQLELHAMLRSHVKFPSSKQITRVQLPYMLSLFEFHGSCAHVYRMEFETTETIPGLEQMTTSQRPLQATAYFGWLNILLNY